MKVRVKVTVFLNDPPGTWENEQDLELTSFPETERHQKEVADAAVAGTLAGGMLYRKIDDNTRQYIPLRRVKDVQVEFAKIVGITDTASINAAKGANVPPGEPLIKL